MPNNTITTYDGKLFWVDPYNSNNKFTTALVLSVVPFLGMILLILIVFAIMTRIFTLRKQYYRRKKAKQLEILENFIVYVTNNEQNAQNLEREKAILAELKRQKKRRHHHFTYNDIPQLYGWQKKMRYSSQKKKVSDDTRINVTIDKISELNEITAESLEMRNHRLSPPRAQQQHKASISKNQMRSDELRKDNRRREDDDDDNILSVEFGIAENQDRSLYLIIDKTNMSLSNASLNKLEQHHESGGGSATQTPPMALTINVNPDMSEETESASKLNLLASMLAEKLHLKRAKSVSKENRQMRKTSAESLAHEMPHTEEVEVEESVVIPKNKISDNEAPSSASMPKIAKKLSKDTIKPSREEESVAAGAVEIIVSDYDAEMLSRVNSGGSFNAAATDDDNLPLPPPEDEEKAAKTNQDEQHDAGIRNPAFQP